MVGGGRSPQAYPRFFVLAVGFGCGVAFAC